MSPLRDELKKLGTSSLVYLLPTFLARGLAFVLSPVYAAVLGASAFGIVGFAGTLAPLMTTVLGFGVASSANRLHHDFADDRERRGFYGSIVIFLLVVPVSIGVVVELLGTRYGSPFLTLPYVPYGRLVLWTGVLGVLPSAFVNVFVARENAKAVAGFNVASIVVTVALTVLLVVVLRQGAEGQLTAMLLAAVFNGLLALLMLRSVVTWKLSWSKLRSALVFGVPIVPHQLSNWALGASDRAILERFVSTADLGRYSLGYTFGTVTSFVGVAVSLALGPMVNRRLKADAADPTVPKMASLALLVTTFVGLEVALLGGPCITLVTRAEYAGAEAIVPWVSAAYVFQALYQIVSLGTFFSKRTAAVPIVTAAAAASNIVLNLIMVPRYGIRAAAVTTLIAYMLFAATHGLLAHKLHPISWEYGRLLRIAAAALVTYFIARLVDTSAVMTLVTRAGLSALFPAFLLAFGAVSRKELKRAAELARGFLDSRRRPPVS